MTRRDVKAAGPAAHAAEAHPSVIAKVRSSLFIEKDSDGTRAILASLQPLPRQKLPRSGMGTNDQTGPDGRRCCWNPFRPNLNGSFMPEICTFCVGWLHLLRGVTERQVYEAMVHYARFGEPGPGTHGRNASPEDACLSRSAFGSKLRGSCTVSLCCLVCFTTYIAASEALRRVSLVLPSSG